MDGNDALFISVDYIENHPLTYKGVVVAAQGSKELYRCYTKDYRTDLYNARAVAEEHSKEIWYQSSIDHFIADCRTAGLVRDNP